MQVYEIKDRDCWDGPWEGEVKNGDWLLYWVDGVPHLAGPGGWRVAEINNLKAVGTRAHGFDCGCVIYMLGPQVVCPKHLDAKTTRTWKVETSLGFFRWLYPDIQDLST